MRIVFVETVSYFPLSLIIDRWCSYKPYLEKFLADNEAYWRFCSAETLEEERKKAESEEKTPRYAGTCRAKTSAEAACRVSQGE